MAFEIQWTKRADKKLDQIISHLQQDWGEKSVRDFMTYLYDFLDLLSGYPEIGAIQYPEKGIRAFVLKKQLTIYYKVSGKQILLLDLFDNRSDPDTKIF